MEIKMIFTCPVCGGKLNIDESRAAKCDNRHSFDSAKQGYYNLLLSGGDHGDNKEMVLARRSFLGGGFYEPLAKRIAELCRDSIGSGAVVLDAGCGEGYYTEHLSKEVKPKNAYILAFDISRDAVREAAKKRCADEYAVASSYHIPLPDFSVDMVLNTFSPQAPAETLRVLRRGGFFVMAIPGEEHLFGLKSKIYDTPYKNEVKDTYIEGFELILREELRYPLALRSASEVRDLFMMTPYAYRTSKEGRERVLSLDSLECEAHFIILIYKKV